MQLTDQQISSLASDESSIKAGRKQALASKWFYTGESERAIWGEIQGSGKSRYKTQVDLQDIAFKCSCPSRKFPCKHTLGLLYLAAAQPDLFGSSVEPDRVVEWIDKRRQKDAPAPNLDKPIDAKEQAKKDKAKADRLAERLAMVGSGVSELKLWLEDLVRLGLLHLPQKKASDFQNVAARMVDAKAPGLAGLVRRLSNVDYSHKDEWIDQAMGIIAEMYLLIRSYKRYDLLTEEWQYTLRSLLGWSQSTKELLADDQAPTYDDQWLTIGQNREQQDDLIIQRTWLLGLQTGITGLVLDFGTRFSPLKSTLTAGVVIESKVAFFPSVWKDRAVIKQTTKTLSELPMLPLCHSSWTEFSKHKAGAIATYPWASSISFVVQDLRLVIEGEEAYLCDKDRNYIAIDSSLGEDARLRLLAITGGQPSVIAGVHQEDKVLPLGIFSNDKYHLL